MDPEFTRESSGQNRPEGDSAASSGTNLPPRQALPPRQDIVSPPYLPQEPVEATGPTSPDTEQSFAPTTGDAPPAGYAPPVGYPTQPSYPPQPGYPPQMTYPPSYGYPPSPPSYGYFNTAWTSPAGPAPGLAWGGISIRTGAMILDFVFLCIFGTALALIMGTPGLTTVNGTIEYQSLANVIDATSWTIFLAYVPVCWYFFQGTLGQRMLGLRIVRVSDGKKLGIGHVLLRYLAWATLICPCGIPAVIAAGIGADDPHKRTWVDFAGESVVVRKI